MSSISGGIALPESVLSSWWFILLATVVAFNTIIYLGLTLAKMIPLPRQFHPSLVRKWLRGIGVDVDSDTATDEIPTRVLPESDNPYENMRGGIAKLDIPQAFALVGGLVVLLSTVALIAPIGQQIVNTLDELVTGLLFLAAAQILMHRNFRARTMMWCWAVGCVLLVEVALAEAIWLHSEVSTSYALVVMSAFAPVVLAWRPTMVAAAVMFVSFSVTVIWLSPGRGIRLTVAAFAALMVSMILLRLRLVALDALSDEQAKSEALATTDVLTGVLTRNGLLSLMPAMAGIAERVNLDVCVMFFDINSLARANADYGVHYGDDILIGVAQAIRSKLRAGDFVARWGGDEFLVVGLGPKPDAELLASRIEEAVRISGINLGRWPTTLTTGTVAGDPTKTTFNDLVAEAIEQAGNSMAVTAT